MGRGRPRGHSPVGSRAPGPSLSVERRSCAWPSGSAASSSTPTASRPTPGMFVTAIPNGRPGDEFLAGSELRKFRILGVDSAEAPNGADGLFTVEAVRPEEARSGYRSSTLSPPLTVCHCPVPLGPVAKSQYRRRRACPTNRPWELSSNSKRRTARDSSAARAEPSWRSRNYSPGVVSVWSQRHEESY